MTNLGLSQESNVNLTIEKSINVSQSIKRTNEKKSCGYFNRCRDSIWKI